MKNLILIFLPLFIFPAIKAGAQNLVRQEVKVVKPYEPVISDAFKINELPKIVDTLKVTPSFSYEITPNRYETIFKPHQIKPAKLISEPLPKLYHSYVRVGFGTYLSPLAEIYFGSERSENWLWDASLTYHSSNGKLINEANKKVYAGLSAIQSEVNGKYFFKNSNVFSAGALIGNNKNYYYGYNPESIDSTVSVPLKKDNMDYQSVNYFQGKVRWQTNYLDSLHVNYDIGVKWQTLQAKNQIGENVLNIDAFVDYFMNNQFIGVDAAIDYYNPKGLIDSTNFAVVKFSPWVGAFGNKWRILAGVNTFYDLSTEKYHFSPKISMHYNVIDYFLIPYFEYDGPYKVNSYKKIYDENPFIMQNLSVKPTEYSSDITFGFRGNISSKVAFNLKANYASINNQYFYVNDTTNKLQNKFDVVYDDITRFRFLGEISYKSSEKLFISLKGNYYQYTMKNELKAWHMPDYSLSLNTRYNLQDKLIVDINVFGIGTRYAKEYDSLGNVVAKELQGIIDLNLGVEYRYSKVLSGFIKLNNIGAVKYYKWNHYPTQRFNIMVGATYSF